MTDTPVITRFAPSPTGFLHIGGARTALFNWLYARNQGGKFLLRIEDTDRARSTPEATKAILDGMAWLGLDYDGEAISQFARADRHAEVAHSMVDAGKAYRCFASQDEIEAFREAARAEGTSTLYRSPWRDADPATHPDAPYVVRLKAPLEGATTIKDKVQGKVVFKNDTLDDLVLLRSDGTPTYMLAVVVDDHDMEVTHVIRGDDHLVNAARQTLIYLANGWRVPTFAHIPLIHGEDGKKLSKRHGALGVEEYRAMGYPAAAMRNYLARLGWSHGNDEFFTTKQAIEWFSFAGIGKSPSRFDFKKLENLSGQHMKATASVDLVDQVDQFFAMQHGQKIAQPKRDLMQEAMPSLVERAKTFPKLLETAHFILADRPLVPDEKAEAQLDTVSRGMLKRLTERLQNVTWSPDDLEETVKDFAASQGLKLGQIAQPLRAGLTGRTVSPSIFNVMVILGREESVARLLDASDSV